MYIYIMHTESTMPSDPQVYLAYQVPTPRRMCAAVQLYLSNFVAAAAAACWDSCQLEGSFSSVLGSNVG